MQGFPEDYQFFGPSQKSLGAQIGNAVPVSLAEAVGRHIMTLAGMIPKKAAKKRKP